MASAIEVFRTRIDALESRDKKALGLLTAFISALVLYYGIWSPANSFLESRRADRDTQLSLLSYMRRTEADARSGGGGRDAAPTGQALLSQVSQTAQRYNVKPNRLQPEGTDGVSVWFDAAPFDNLVGWLEEEARQGVIVRQISIDRQDQPGVVNARVVLRN